MAASTLVDHLLYAGTDDGKVWICRAWKRKSWTDLSETIPAMPQGRWITRIEASRLARDTVYLAVDRHRNDDYQPYVFKSVDYGRNWTSIVGNLPEVGHVHVIREDPVQPKLLYVGTEFGLFISIDAGQTWHKQKHLPTVPVHDLVIHPRDRELVIGTHGRAIWIMDVLPLQELTAKARADEVHFCTIRPSTAFRQEFKQRLGVNTFYGENAPYGAVFHFNLRDKPSEQPVLTILDAKEKKVIDFKAPAAAGLHRLTWTLNKPGTEKDAFNPVAAGMYTASLRVGEKTFQQKFQVEVDE